ncbi:hypothetical protein [Streptomyces halobius]|uniref:Type VII secretion system (Wss) protein ESAT-6 n=1 Tax=Streptomyces halobius TaxID=2879846 RepID=A0ABY4MDU3_9ACTN|nr:hypothetical protein [Streptomyces halobius]UQA95492.1 hypothetical protein K9S39_29800 [Streptomyces halobius]
MGDVVGGAGGFQTDVESLKAEGTNFVKLGDDFYQSVVRLMNGLHALGAGPPADPSNEKAPEEKSFGEQFWGGLTSFASKDGAPPWGDDEIGEKFGVVYEGVRDGMNESMGHLSSKLQEIGKALTSMSTNYAEGEDFSESLMKQHVENKQAWQDPTKQPPPDTVTRRAEFL